MAGFLKKTRLDYEIAKEIAPQDCATGFTTLHRERFASFAKKSAKRAAK